VHASQLHDVLCDQAVISLVKQSCVSTVLDSLRSPAPEYTTTVALPWHTPGPDQDHSATQASGGERSRPPLSRSRRGGGPGPVPASGPRPSRRGRSNSSGSTGGGGGGPGHGSSGAGHRAGRSVRRLRLRPMSASLPTGAYSMFARDAGGGSAATSVASSSRSHRYGGTPGGAVTSAPLPQRRPSSLSPTSWRRHW
jgi:hypothetical protein